MRAGPGIRGAALFPRRVRFAMIFAWLKRRRRRRLLAEPFPKEWLVCLRRNVPFYSRLDEDEQRRLRDALRIFVAEKEFEGCGGLAVTEEIKVTIAAQACLLLLGMEKANFDHVKTILVYPHEYFGREKKAVRSDGTIRNSVSRRAGEAWYGGPVVLSWSDARRGALLPGDGFNVVFHEFAHKLDMLDGVVDGTPPLKSREEYKRWTAVMTREFKKLKVQSEGGMATLLDGYGARDPGEFFAVCTECFFERPSAFARRHPEIYALLKDYYGQDPARWRDRGVDGKELQEPQKNAFLQRE